jgi:hypothetical protein
MEQRRPGNTDEAIWEIYGRVVKLETTLLGTPNTQSGGLVQAVQEIKDLAVEVKDKNILQGESLTWLTTRCRAFHGERNDVDKAAEPPKTDKNPLSSISKARLIAFLVAAGTVVGSAVYNLGLLTGWWKATPPFP